MSNELMNAIQVSAYGLRAQGERVRVITENVANADTAATAPGEKPYTRKIITFQNHMDKASGVDLVKVKGVTEDQDAQYVRKYMPDHPGADKDGYVEMPNVNMLVEMMDVREAQRSYEANLSMIEQAKAMIGRTIDLLRI